MTPRAVATPATARGIAIGKLERKALDDPTLQAGCGLRSAYECCDPCWQQWLCARLMEHLHGERHWQELDRGDFGLLRRRWRGDLALLEQVVARIATGADVIAVLTWAVEREKPLEDVMAILRTLDPNGRRVARFAWLSWAPPCGRA